jgi:ubiquinone/menaquinone biosynthesis C-methylase UbiE
MMHYKFLDVGCKNGGSFIRISSKYKYTPEQGIGIDINKKHVNEFIKTGNHAIIASADDMPFPDNSFELVIFNHVLEHMKDEESGFRALAECIRVSSKRVFVGLPFFDEDEYLKKLKFKTFYSDWSGHLNKIHLKKILDFISGKQFSLNMKKKISDSFAPEILPINAPRNSKDYDQELHGIKDYVKFDRDIWREYELVIIK